MTVERARLGFERLLARYPVVQSLRSVENNIAHIDDKVFVHTKNTHAMVKEAMKFEMVSDIKSREALKDPFRRSFAGTIRNEMLETAAFLHDVAKTEENMIIEEGTGHTYFPKHEANGAELARKLLKEEGKYEEGAISHIEKLIEHHSEFNSIWGHLPKRDLPLSGWDASEERMEAAQNLKRDNRDIYFDLIVLSIADMQGSQLEELNPEEYKARMDDYRRLLNEDPTDILGSNAGNVTV